MPEGEEVVRMKIVLDEKSMDEAARTAEDKINQPAGKPKRPAKEEEERGKKQGMGMGQALKGVFKDIFADSPLAGGGTKAAMAGGMVGGIAGGLVGGTVAALIGELGKLLSAIKQLATTLARYNPFVFASLRRFQIAMRGIAIQLANILEPMLQGIFEALGSIIVLVVQILKPALVGVAAILGFLLKGIAGVLRILSWLSGMVNKVVAKIMNGIAWVFDGIAKIMWGKPAAEMRAAAEWMRRAAEQMGRTDPMQQATEMNRAFIQGLRDASREQAQETEGPDKGKAAADATKRDPGIVRKPVIDSPRPAIGEFKQRVEFNLEMKLQHEEAVQRAIEMVRSKLVHGLNTVRNETLQLGNIMNAKNILDGISGR
jgi:hypothetical protein